MTLRPLLFWFSFVILSVCATAATGLHWLARSADPVVTAQAPLVQLADSPAAPLLETPAPLAAEASLPLPPMPPARVQPVTVQAARPAPPRPRRSMVAALRPKPAPAIPTARSRPQVERASTRSHNGARAVRPDIEEDWAPPGAYPPPPPMWRTGPAYGGYVYGYYPPLTY